MPPREITPWSSHQNLVGSAEVPDLDKAKEVTPILMFGVLPPLVAFQSGLDLRPVNHEDPNVKVEAKAPADETPKGANPDSSVTDNASFSEGGTIVNGQPEITDLMSLHPSSQPRDEEKIASAVKELSQELPPFSV